MSCQYIAKFNRYKPDKLRINIQLQTRHKRYSFFLPVGKPWSCHHLHRGLQIIPAKAAQCVILLLKWPYISTIWLVIHNHVSPDLTLISLFSEIQRKEKGIHSWLALRFQWGDFSTPTEPFVLKLDFPAINSLAYFPFFSLLMGWKISSYLLFFGGICGFFTSCPGRTWTIWFQVLPGLTPWLSGPCIG